VVITHSSKITRHDDHYQELAGEKPKPSQASTSSQTISERISICIIHFDVTKHHWPDVPMAAAVCYVPAILLAGLMRRWSAISDTLLDWKLFMLRRLPPSPSQRLPLGQKDSGASDDTVHELDAQQEINWCANSYESV
jgi:hypothetical protein